MNPGISFDVDVYFDINFANLTINEDTLRLLYEFSQMFEEL